MFDGAEVRWLQFLPNTHRLVLDSRKTWLWNLATDDVKVLEGNATVSLDGRWFNIGKEFFSTATGEPLSDTNELLSGRADTPDAHLLLFCTRGKPMKYLDVPLATWYGFSPNRASPLSNDGRYCLTRAKDACEVVDARTQARLAAAKGAFGWLAISPDGQLALIKDYEDSRHGIWLWDWKVDRRIPLPTNQRGATVEFSPDGRYILSETRWTTEPQTMIVWGLSHPASPRKLWEKSFGSLGVTTFSPDGKYILGAIRDEQKTLVLLKTETGEEVCTLRHGEPGGIVLRVAISSDSRLAASARLGEPAIHVWNLPDAAGEEGMKITV